VSAPVGFSVSLPADTITLKSYSSGYLWAYVTSPSTIPDGDYPITVSVRRAGTADSQATATTYYKVYLADTSAPTVYWPNPADGQTISGRSYNVIVSSSDDHAVKKIDLYLDGAFASSAACDNISYTCQLSYKASSSAGQHTATFRSYDWMGNVSVMTVAFTAG
jgi:Bacterial Ig domain